MRDNAKNEQCRQLYAEILPRLSDYVYKYARERPNDIAIIEYNTETEVTWKEFADATKAFAAKLLDMGIKKGEIIATSLPLLKEHVFLMYACYQIGVIIAPLDLRLKIHELDKAFEQIHPKAYFFIGKPKEDMDFRPMVAELMDKYEDVCKYWIQFDMLPTLILKGAIWIRNFAADIKKHYIRAILTGSVKAAMQDVDKRDPCLIIFTTGSTGWPKPALICHENILIQNIGIKVAFDITSSDRMCVNLPPSHVGCVTEQLATTIFAGGVSVILHIFDAEKTLDAIEKYKVTAFGQIPALFNMQWRLPNYKRYDLSTLRFALYGGQAVSREFLIELSKMAPHFGTGLGLTETAGFVTYSPLDGTIEDIAASVGFDMPLCPISIRDIMKEDGTAGAEKKSNEIGEITFSGPQIFLGYLNNEEKTQKTVSKDGFCYTGDLGFYDDKGLHFAGRSKFVIKPKGYQVFPAEIESFISTKLEDKVENVAVVGVEHKIYSEAIIVFVEVKDGQKLTTEEVLNVCKDLAAYKRPSWIVLLKPEEIPLNRVAKIDYIILKKEADKIVKELREKGKWDK